MKLLKLFTIIFFVIALTTTFLVTACTKPAPDTEPTTPPPSSKPEVIELKFSHFIPPEAPWPTAWAVWAEEVEKQTDGRVTITFYPSESLVKIMDTYPALVGGVTDIGPVPISFFPGQFPLHEGLLLPMMGFAGHEAHFRVLTELHETFPELAAEYAEFKPLWYTGGAGNFLHLRGKVVHVPDDMKGLRLFAPGGEGEFAEAMGAAPVMMSPFDMYSSLDRGVIDGTTFNWQAFMAHKLQEVTDYHLLGVDFSYMNGVVGMNMDTWNSLPADIQGIIEELSAVAVEQHIIVGENTDEAAMKICLDLGHTIYTPTPEELALWQDVANQQQDKWAAEIETKGLPGRAIIDETLGLAKMYK